MANLRPCIQLGVWFVRLIPSGPFSGGSTASYSHIRSPLGFAAPGTLFAAASANVKLREALLPVLLFPIALPALIGGVECTAVLLQGRPLADAAIWLKILGAFDLIFVVVGFLLFEFTMEE